MLSDLVLAMAHHLLAFLLVGALAMGIATVRPGLRASDLPRLGRIDGLYGAIALALIIVGVGRVLFGLKSWDYYVYYWVFWAKMAAFVAVGLLSIPPTIRIIRWRRDARAGMDTIPETEIRSMRGFLMAEATFLVLIPLLAAAMARGVGY